MKPFKFLSNPFLEYQKDMEHYEEGYEEATQDMEANMWYNWVHRCPYSIGTREHEMWGEGYRDYFRMHEHRLF